MGIVADRIRAGRPVEPEPPTVGQAAAQGLGAGVDFLTGTAGSIAEAAGFPVGQRIRESAAARTAERTQAAGVGGVEDIESLGDAARFAAFNIAANVPQIAAVLAGGGAGGAILSRLAGPGARTVGQVVGGVTAGAPLQFGEQFAELREAGVSVPEARSAALGATPARTALEVAPLQRLAFGRVAPSSSRLRGAARTGVETAITEGVTEAGQELVGAITTLETLTGGQALDFNDPQLRSRLVNALVAGGLVGGVAGTAGGAVRQQPVQEVTEPTVDTAVEPAATEAEPQPELTPDVLLRRAAAVRQRRATATAPLTETVSEPAVEALPATAEPAAAALPQVVEEDVLRLAGSLQSSGGSVTADTLPVLTQAYEQITTSGLPVPQQQRLLGQLAAPFDREEVITAEAAPVPELPDFRPRLRLPAPAPSEAAAVEAVPDNAATYTPEVRSALADDASRDVREILVQPETNLRALVDSRRSLLQQTGQNISPERAQELERFVRLGTLELQARQQNPELERAAGQARTAFLADLEQRGAQRITREERSVDDEAPLSLEQLQEEEVRQAALDQYDDDFVDPYYSSIYKNSAATIKSDAEAAELIARANKVRETVRGLIGDNARVRVGILKDAGTFDPTNSVIAVALNQADPISVAAHEAYHAAQHSVLTKAERDIVARSFRRNAMMRKRLDAVVANSPDAEAIQPALATPLEAEAYAFQYWRQGLLEAPSRLERIWTKIRQFFDRVTNAVRGEGFRSWEDVFDNLNAGRYLNRANGAPTTFFDRADSIDNIVAYGETDRQRKLLRNAAATVPEGTPLTAAQDVLESLHEKIPTRGLRTYLRVPKERDISLYVKRAWGSVGTMYNVARHSKQGRKVFQLVDEQARYKEQLVADADAQFQSWIEENDDATLQKIGGVLYDVTRTRLGSVSDSELAGLDIDSEALDARGRLSTDELQARGLNDREIELYQNARSALNNVIRARAKALSEQAVELGIGARSQSILANAKKLIAEGYVPLRRFGTFAVNVADPTGKTVGFFVFESQAAAANAEGVIKESLKDTPGLTTNLTTISQERLMDSTFSLTQFLSMVDHLGLQLPDGARENIVKMLTDADSRARNELLRRENIPGFSRDIMRTLAEFIESAANSTASAVYSKRISEVIGDESQWRGDGPLGGYYRDKMIQMVQFVRGEGTTPDTFATALRSSAAMVHLGGSISGMLVNFSQIPLATMPYLSQFGPVTRVYADTLQAMRQVSKPRMGDPVALRRAVERGRGSGGLSLDETEALLRGIEEGFLAPQQAYTMMGLAQGRMMARSTTFRKATELWMAPFTFAETVNRRTTFTAAYRVAKNLRQSDPQQFGPEGRWADEYDFALRAVEETQGIYNKYNRPAWARQGWGSVLYTFKSFPTIMVELAANMTPKGRALMLGTLFLSAGFTGLPFMEDLMDASAALAKLLGIEDPRLRDPERAVREVFSFVDAVSPFANTTDMLMHGIADSSGVNISGRLGLGRIVPGMEGLAAWDFGKFAWDFIGPAGQPLIQELGTLPDALRGDALSFFKGQPIKAVRDAAKAYEAWQSGAELDSRGYVVAPVSPHQVLLRAIGFTPTEAARQYEASAYLRRSRDFMLQKREDLSNDLAAAIQADDREEIDRILEAVAAWNDSRDNPLEILSIDSAAIGRRIRSRQLTPVERSIEQLAKYQLPAATAELERLGFAAQPAFGDLLSDG